jgi:chemotaxis protein MotB
MAKKKKCPECEACEKWAVPTADFFSLLLALFIALYAIASQNKDKMKSMSKAFAEIFDFRPLTLSLIPPLDQMAQKDGAQNTNAKQQEQTKQSKSESKEKVVQQAKQLMKDLSKLNDARDEQGNGSETEVIMTDEGIRIRMLNSIVFGDGSAELNPAARKVVDILGGIIKQYPNDIKVEGHTAEPSPPKSSPYPSNWELSSARASSVVRALIEKGYNPKRFTVVGFADTKPLSIDEAAKKHFLNQRVDIILMKYENKIDDLPTSSLLDSKP